LLIYLLELLNSKYFIRLILQFINNKRGKAGFIIDKSHVTGKDSVMLATIYISKINDDVYIVKALASTTKLLS
jgi:hypothetical protein